ncbi:MAG: eukaryotic-like serine/threonine-protein kinase [Pseudonocardiales bacterium]|jgi:serine/threonine protein kinase|nr:eukaryotic-like serine/threonine-protein kinase [Pseudonocardiales bacterium]
MTSEIEPERTRIGSVSSIRLPAGPPGRHSLLGERYELGQVLGHGGVGTVYLARDVVLDRAVAVKLFRPDAAAADQADRYEREARLLAGLSHRGLVAVFDAGIDDSVPDEPKPFLVMELVDGDTLATRVAEGPIPAEQAAALGAQLATALAYVHGRGVVHRDVKPANILLTDGAAGGPVTAKLTDFGIARLVDSTRMTMHGLTLGTPNYLSPEQVTGGEVGPPADVYALGLVLLECVTGQVVYPGYGVEAAVVRLHRPPAFPPWLDPEFTRLLVAMTQPDPAHRPSAAQTASALSTLAVRAPESSASRIAGAQTQVLPVVLAQGSTAPVPVVRARRSVGWAWVGAALVVVAALVVAVLIASHKTSAPSTVRPPAYPSVPGQLGTHLQELQKQVQP